MHQSVCHRKMKSRKNWLKIFIACVSLFFFSQSAIHAGPARELAEFLTKGMSKAARESALDGFERQCSRALARYGDDCAPFIKQLGREGLETLERAGTNGAAILKWHKQSPGKALYVIRDPDRLALALRHGDEAFDAMIRHPGAAEELFRSYGAPAATWLKSLNQRDALRLAALNQEGWLKRLFSDSADVGKFIKRYGSAGIRFIWNNKGKLSVGGALALFLNDPEAFINGSRKLMEPAWKELWTQTSTTEKAILSLVGLGLAWLILKPMKIWISLALKAMGRLFVRKRQLPIN